MEAHRAAPGAVAEQVLDEPVADVAGVGVVDRVQLDDRPLVAMRLALHAQQAREPARLLVDVEQVVRPERAERAAEQIEHRRSAAR